MNSISPLEFKALWEGSTEQRPVLLDVREPWEVETAHIEGAVCMPLSTVPQRIAELDPQAATGVICHHGMRSLQVAQYLHSQGFQEVFNIEGGIDAWSRDADSSVPRY